MIHGRTLVLAWLCFCAAPAVAADAPQTPAAEQFTWHQTIQTTSAEAIQRFSLSAETYAGAARTDLGDLRIFNGAGEIIPYAIVRREAQTETLTEATPLRYFPVYAQTQSTADQLDVDVHRNADGSLVSIHAEPQHGASTVITSYVVDASAIKAPLTALDLQWTAPPEGLALAVEVAASDDLQHWQPAVSNAQLVELRMGDQQLLRNRIDLDGVHAKYLRLRWDDEHAALHLTKLVAQTQTTQSRAAATQWTPAVSARAGEHPGEYLFEAPGVPVQALRIALPQANTVAPVQLYRRDDAKSPWSLAANATVFRIQRNGHEITSPELAIGRTPTREWKLVVDQRGGGLGQGLPRIEFAWVAHQVVFVARGAGPYTLAYGLRTLNPAPFDIATLVPGYRDDQFANLPLAQLGPAVRANNAPAPKTSIDTPSSMNPRTMGLWAVLILGVAALGFMAWRLIGQLGKDDDKAASQ